MMSAAKPQARSRTDGFGSGRQEPVRRSLLRQIPAPGPNLPRRYRIRGDGEERVLTCPESPTLTIRSIRGESLTASAARNHPPGAIFLDGAAQGEPFLDPPGALYNLDHHEGCVRAFTLATCEQALVLIRKWVDLRRRDFVVYVNDADLDTVLAVWVLMNHLRLNEEGSRSRKAILPLLRLEGCVDAHGLELADLCALSDSDRARATDWMQRLRARELRLKESGRWGRTDLLEFLGDRLGVIDSLVYTSDDFDRVADVDELARAELPSGSVVVVCRSRLGIYELEQQLRRFHGERLGVLVLQKDDASCSIRQVDPTLPAPLEAVYDRLNLVDPASGGRLAANRWGGSTDIGGSPRSTGTGLSPVEIASAIREAHAPPTLFERLRVLAFASLCAGALPLAAFAPLWVPGFLRRSGVGDAAPFAAALIGLGAVFLLLLGRRTPGVYGLRRPRGRGWWKLLPLALLGGAAGGTWTSGLAPPELLGKPAAESLAIFLAALIALPVAAELFFRGVVQGNLARVFAHRHGLRRGLLSWPVLVSSGFYALLSITPPLALLHQGQAWFQHPAWPVALCGALLFGIAAASARERSGSVLAPIAFHGITSVLLLGAQLFSSFPL